MSTPFDKPRPLFAVADRQPGWGALLASSLAESNQGERSVDVRHLDDLEPLDTCLLAAPMPVAILLADDFVELAALASFVRRHARRRDTMIVVAQRRATDSASVSWMLREAGAHEVVGDLPDVLRLSGALERFFRAYYDKENHNYQ